MEYRHLGRSGLRVSEIIYGNWLTHGSQIDIDTSKKCIAAALDAGITTFDTADAYARGRAEEIMGAALKGQRRASYELFTKVFWATGPGENERSLSRKHIVEACNASLQRLGVEYVDLYQAHRFDYSTPLEETLRAFDDLVRAGKVLYIGVSEWRAEEIAEALRIADDMGFDRLVSNQPQYNMVWRIIESEVVPLCEKEGIGQIVWSPIAQGVLTGKYQAGSKPPEGSRGASEKGAAFVRRYLGDELLNRVERLKPIAQEHGLSLAQLAIAWVLQNSNVSGAIVGASRPKQVTENAEAAGVRLSSDTMRDIDEILDPVIERDPSLTSSPAERP